MNVRSLFLLLYLAIAASTQGQTFKFTTYNSANGLSQNSGYCMAQDAFGYLWMGTQDGINIFNGKKITAWYKENIHRGRLPDNFIKALFFDSLQNRMWIGTASGLCIYDMRADSFFQASKYISGADTLNGLMIRSIVKGRTPREIVVVSNSEGLFVCNTQARTVQQFLQAPETKNNVTAATVWNNEVVATANRSLYTITSSAVPVLYDPLLEDVRQLYVWEQQLWAASTKNGTLFIDHLTDRGMQTFECGSKDAGCFATDAADNLWIGTRTKGLVIVEPRQRAIVQTYESAPNQHEWPKKFTLSLLKDRQGNMWAGSSGGGFAVKANTQKDFVVLQKKELQYGKAAHNMILSLYKPAGNLLYAGTQLEGLRQINITTGQITTIENPDASGNSVYSIDASGNNDYWLATLAGLYHLHLPTKKFTHFAESLPESGGFGEYVKKLKQHDSLLYSTNKGLVLFDLKTKSYQPFPYREASGKHLHIVSHKILENATGDLWIGTTGLGLLSYRMHDGNIRIIPAVQQFSKTVNDLLLDGDTLWIATNNGLVLYHVTQDKILATFSAANGLPGNVLYSIQKDRQGNFWCGSNAGLLKVDRSTYAITQVKASAGLQADEFNTGCATGDAAGNLYFGGIEGISVFNPSSFSIDTFSPAPLIESIQIDNKELRLDKGIHFVEGIQLNHQQNSITIEFGVTNFINHEECLYRYKLEGMDADWVYPGTRNYVNYTGLQPGHYRFLLQSSNSSAVWSSAITTLSIELLPAWWQTWWCYLLVACCAALLVFMIIRKRIGDIRYRAEMKQKITETEMAALKAQMNPHFMFNCINSIDAFIHSNDKYNATLYLNKFAKLLRNILDSSKQNVVLLSKDVDTLRLYIELEELRHENKFTSAITAETELLNSDYKVPPLIVQPFVENAILHGLKNLTGNTGKLYIDIRKAGEAIQYCIRDNGVGRAAAKQLTQNKEASYGMDMSRERIKLFNKEAAASVAIEDLYENGIAAGTTITVKLKTT